MTANSTDPMIGRLLDGRYQIRSRIARGGMATVYLATDLRLERRVAIKVMHGHLADDSRFKERFIQEARSAARLAHPNVVNVFDQGQDSELAYLVMEYLPGITLRELLQEHHVLTTEQTLDIMEAVLSGLAAAHKAGIVHRDLKPENVMLADDGRIKIGDFGLARAASANTATGAALLGTIAYLSPELVTRGLADTRSDIYAVGIMMYEMLVGEQPFRGEQPMQIAYQHANDTVPAPSAKNPKVPHELDEIVQWATERDPEQRPRDARAMLDQLYETHSALMSSLPPSGTTSAMRTMVLPSAPPAAPAAPEPERGDTAETQVFGQRGRPAAALVAAAPSGPTQRGETPRRNRRWVVVVAVIGALLVAAAGIGAYFTFGPPSRTVIPSDIKSMEPAAARAELESLGLVVEPDGQTSSVDVPAGLVAESDPAIGSSVPNGSTVQLLISTGPRLLPVPTLKGLAEDQARQAIDLAGFEAQDSIAQFDAEVPEGTVIDALDADGASLDGRAEYGEQQPVTLIVSVGPVPDVSGLSPADATSRLAAAELSVGATREDEYSDSIPQGAVIRALSPDGGPVRPGGTVDLITSRGPELVVVPDVVGLSWDEAKPQLEAAGFDLSYNIFADAAPALFEVTGLDPAGGSEAPKGSTVRVTFTT
ncbi:MAG TPA: Stk1 family PASTA domain-containing Ser/Thr kinase [Rhodoglobus sp.]|nr:Stk1 family PASTA domain-containing Ser/Thr kinase [Rhodoglobus sp.]